MILMQSARWMHMELLKCNFMKNNYTTNNRIRAQRFSNVPCTEFHPGLGRTVKEVMADFVRGIRPNELPINSPFRTAEQAEQLIILEGRQTTRLEAVRQLHSDRSLQHALYELEQAEKSKEIISAEKVTDQGAPIK